MHPTNPAIHVADEGIAGTEAKGEFLERDYLLYRPDETLTIGESGYRAHPVAIERNHCLVFRNGLLVSALRSQDLGL